MDWPTLASLVFAGKKLNMQSKQNCIAHCKYFFFFQCGSVLGGTTILPRMHDLVFNKRPVLANHLSSSMFLWCNGKPVFDEWTAESLVARGLDSPGKRHTSNPGPVSVCVCVWISQWWKLQQTQSCRTNGQVGREWGAADPTLPKKTQLITSVLTLHTYVDTHTD